MNVLPPLLRKHFLESRWIIVISSAAFFGLAILSTWLTLRFELLIELGELGKDVRRFGFLRGLGGPEMDYSTTALEICWWNHPVIILTVLSWAISRGAASVAGEIERGTIDVTLSRPISRSAYLTSQVIYTLLGLAALVGALILGTTIGGMIWTLKNPPTILTLLKPGTMVFTLGLAVFGYTLPVSAADSVRWRATLVASILTLAGLIAMSVAPIYDGYQWLERVSVFRAYAPVTVALKGDPLAYNSGVLILVATVGITLSYWLFNRRDLPSNS